MDESDIIILSDDEAAGSSKKPIIVEKVKRVVDCEIEYISSTSNKNNQQQNVKFNNSIDAFLEELENSFSRNMPQTVDVYVNKPEIPTNYIEENQIDEYQEKNDALEVNLVKQTTSVMEPIFADQTNDPEPAKKKRRTKKEIEEEKILKEINKLKREAQAAKNSKCEQYLNCYVNTSILELLLESRFSERSLSEQLIFDTETTNSMQIIWKRKRIDAFLEDGKLNTIRTMEIENVSLSILSGETFTNIAKTENGKELWTFYIKDLVRLAQKQQMINPQIIIAIVGQHSLAANIEIVFEVYERYRAQFRLLRDGNDLSYLIAQTHRAIAKMEKRSEAEKRMEKLPVFNVSEKGILNGPHLVKDWWTRMLERMHRLSEEQKRAIVSKHPCPFRLMDELLVMPAGEAMYNLAGIEESSGRRIGPVIAQKIYRMLTSQEGDEILYAG